MSASPQTRIRPQRGDLPPNYSDLMAAINKSRMMLEWEDDWDGEGSPAYSEETWLRATGFLQQNAEELWRKIGFAVAAPKVGPGPNGSIDLHWRTGEYELLLNIPTDSSAQAEFYGDNNRGEVVKGSLDIASSALWLFLWLAK